MQQSYLIVLLVHGFLASCVLFARLQQHAACICNKLQTCLLTKSSGSVITSITNDSLAVASALLHRHEGMLLCCFCLMNKVASIHV